MRYLLTTILLIMVMLTSCIEDGFTSSPSDQPLFSVDTLDMGVIYSDEQSGTYRFTVHNPHAKGLLISSVELTGENADKFRLNVDGIGGKSFANVEIRAKDSIFVFVDAFIPPTQSEEPIEWEAGIDFHINGCVTTMPLRVAGQDIKRLQGIVLDADMRLEAGIPYQLKDSLVVSEGVTLTLDAGVRLLCHDASKIIVHGTFRAEGTAEKPIIITGDRTGNVITDVPFDLMSRQWGGIFLTKESKDHYLAFTDISNTCTGVTIEGDGASHESVNLTMENVRLRNSGGSVLSSDGASIAAYGCEFSGAAEGLVNLIGGSHRFDQCTFANHYLFVYPTKSYIYFINTSEEDGEEYAGYLPIKAEITNSILAGLSMPFYPLDITEMDVHFRRCLFDKKGDNDDNFIDCIWDADPLYYTVRDDYLFDYRVKPDSPAIAVAYPGLSEHLLTTDYYGLQRQADLGAYVFSPPEEE